MLYSKLSWMQLQKVVYYKVLVGATRCIMIFHDIYNKVVSCSLDLRQTYMTLYPFNRDISI